MKIISNFKDFYDYISTYYGLDESVIYKRTSFVKKDFNENVKMVDILFDGRFSTVYFIEISDEQRKLFSSSIKGQLVRYIVANGRKYGFIKYENKWQYLTQELYDRIEVEKPEHTSIFSPKKVIVNNGNRNELLDDISKRVNAPIFECTISNAVYERGKCFLAVFEHVPVLKELGFEKLVDVQQFYQELEHYISNVLRDNPDIKPPVIISDKDLIESKGFDKKISFRKRKEKNAT